MLLYLLISKNALNIQVGERSIWRSQSFPKQFREGDVNEHVCSSIIISPCCFGSSCCQWIVANVLWGFGISYRTCCWEGWRTILKRSIWNLNLKTVLQARCRAAPSHNPLVQMGHSCLPVFGDILDPLSGDRKLIGGLLFAYCVQSEHILSWLALDFSTMIFIDVQKLIVLVGAL